MISNKSMTPKSEKNNVIWSYIGTFFVMGVNIFLLPLILHILPNKELGLWYVFASVGSLISLVNFGFSPCIMRNIGHVWGGAQDLLIDDIVIQAEVRTINRELFNNVLRVSKRIYALLGIIVLLLSASVGTIYIISVMDSIEKKYVFLSWGIYSVGLAFNMGFNYWTSLLRGIGAVAESQKANIWSKIVQTIISIIGLLMGYGLIALSVAYLLSGVVLRIYSRINSNKLIDRNQYTDKGKCTDGKIKRIIAINAIKFGANSLSAQIVSQVFQIVSASCFGLVISAQYGLTMQLISLISTIGGVLSTAVLPEINICRIGDNRERQKELLAFSFVSQTLIYVTGTIALVSAGPWVLSFFSKDNTILPLGATLLLSTCCLIESNRAIFTNYMSTANKLLFAKWVVIFSLFTSAITLLLAFEYKVPLLVLITIRLLLECSYNGWKWMKYVLDELEITTIEMFKIAYLYLKNEKTGKNNEE